MTSNQLQVSLQVSQHGLRSGRERCRSLTTLGAGMLVLAVANGPRANAQLPTIGQAPTLRNAPSVGSAPWVQRAPGIFFGPSLQRAPAVQQVPTVQRAPGLQQVPSVQRAPGVQGVPTLGGAPAVIGAPTLVGAPSVRFAPSVQRAPAVQGAPSVQQAPAVGSAPVTTSNMAPAAATVQSGPSAMPRQTEYSITPPRGFVLQRNAPRSASQTVWTEPGGARLTVIIGPAGKLSPRANWERQDMTLVRQYGSRYWLWDIQDTLLDGQPAAFWDYEVNGTRSLTVAVDDGDIRYTVTVAAPRARFETLRPQLEAAIDSFALPTA